MSEAKSPRDFCYLPDTFRVPDERGVNTYACWHICREAESFIIKWHWDKNPAGSPRPLQQFLTNSLVYYSKKTPVVSSCHRWNSSAVNLACVNFITTIVTNSFHPLAPCFIATRAYFQRGMSRDKVRGVITSISAFCELFRYHSPRNRCAPWNMLLNAELGELCAHLFVCNFEGETSLWCLDTVRIWMKRFITVHLMCRM